MPGARVGSDWFQSLRRWVGGLISLVPPPVRGLMSSMSERDAERRRCSTGTRDSTVSVPAADLDCVESMPGASPCSSGGSLVLLRSQVYERAIANVPPVAEKRYWRRYIYLWINYALFEELLAEDVQRTR